MRVAAAPRVAWAEIGDRQLRKIVNVSPHSPATPPRSEKPPIARRTLLLVFSHLAVAALVGGAVAGVFLVLPKVASGAAATGAAAAASPATPGTVGGGGGGGALVTSSMQLLRSGASVMMGDAELASFRAALAALVLGDAGAAASVSVQCQSPAAAPASAGRRLLQGGGGALDVRFAVAGATPAAAERLNKAAEVLTALQDGGVAVSSVQVEAARSAPSAAAAADGLTLIAGPTGPQGDAGTPGPAGPTGAQGAAGPAGPKGIQGAQGAPGPQGAAGPPGVAGPTGAAGDTGPQGAPGPTGVAGPQGVAGSAGATGPAGARGLTGPTGVQGTQGPPGVQGETGAPGATGAPGVNGLDGADGAPGPAGATGPQGTAGADGKDGANGVQGLAGPPGAQGDRGAAGVDGAQGPIGPPGAVGAPGPAGATGPQGTAGADGKDGAQGPAGTAAPAGAFTVEAVFETAASSSACPQPAVVNTEYACCPGPPDIGGAYCSPSACNKYYGGAGVWTADSRLKICAFPVRTAANILPNFAVRAPAAAAGVSYAVADVFNGTTATFLAPRSGLYSLTYTLYLGLPTYSESPFTSSFNGAADLDIVIDGGASKQRVASYGAFAAFTTSSIDFTEPAMYLTTTAAYVIGHRQHVRGGAWSGYLAAGAKVSAELTFRGSPTYSMSLGLLWTGSSFRFSLLVPY